MKKTILQYGLPIILWFMFTAPALADDTVDPPGDVDPDPAPIDQKLYILIFCAILLGIYWIKARKKQMVN